MSLLSGQIFIRGRSSQKITRHDREAPEQAAATRLLLFAFVSFTH